MAGDPKFSNLGVTGADGKPVFLSPNNIATVLGATGGVAPTKFQAGTEGFFTGLGQGQDVVSNISNIQAQQSGIRAQDARTEALELQTQAQEQTQQAEILQTNNEAQQGALVAQITTDKLKSVNTVLQATRSGSADQLVDVISNPATLEAAIQNDPFIQASYAKIKSSSGFTPQQQTAFDTYNRTKQIFNQGPLQQQYQEAASGIVGSPEFQQLQAATGLPTNQLLAGMKIAQANVSGLAGVGPQPVLMAPDGSAIPFTNPDDVAKLSPFFATRDRLQTGGTYELPVGASAATSAAIQPKVVGSTSQAAALPSETPAPTSTPTAVPGAQNAAALPGQNAQGISPNNISPVGTILQTQIPALAKGNSTATVFGDSVTANAMRQAQAAYAQRPYGSKATFEDFYKEGMKTALEGAKVSEDTQKVAATNSTLMTKKRQFADRLENTLNRVENPKDSEGNPIEPALRLGPTWSDWKQRATQGINTFFDSSLNDQVSQIYGDFSALSSEYAINTVQASGLGVQLFNSNMEGQRLVAQGPGVEQSIEFNKEILTRTRGEIKALEDETTLTRFFDSFGVPKDKAAQYSQEYNAQYPTLINDPVSGRFILNPNRPNPIDYANEKLGVKTLDAALEAFTTPTQAPAITPKETPAIGSGTATPFAPAQKDTASAFPSAPQKQNTRGSNYDSTPANQRDLRAIADTASSGGDIRQFQAAGSVPRKLDVATTDLMARLVGAESSGNIKAISETGVRGLAQVTQATFSETAPEAKKAFGIDATDRTDPTESLVVGTTYMNKMLKQFDGNVDLALAAYNAGPGAVQSALDQAGSNTARATIETIAPYLPKTQDTKAYVNKIVGNGRIAPDTATAKSNNQEKPGFFDSVKQLGNKALQVADQLNPLSATEAFADESIPTEPDIGEGAVVAKGIQPDDPNATQIDINNKPEVTPDSTVNVAPAEASVRNDVPPVSEITAALSSSPDMTKAPAIGGGRAIKFIRDSAFGKWLGSLQESGIYKAGQNSVNAATFGLYDEGMGVLNDALGFDGKQVQNEIRASEKDFRRTNPKTAFISDMLGSIAGGVGASIVLRSLGVIKTASSAADGINKASVASTAADASIQGAARGAGEGENAGERIFNAGVGGAAGAVLGGLGQAGSNVPVVGGPAVLGATLGAGAGAISGGQGGDALGGAMAGGAAGVSAGLAAKSPAIQKMITSTVAKLNNYKGLQTLGTLVQKIATNKTPADVVANLTPAEATLYDMISHLEPAKLKSILTELRDTNAKDIPYRLFDSLNDAEINSVLKVIQQIGGSKNNKEIGAKVNEFLAQRSASQVTRLNDTVGPQDLVEQSARRLIKLIDDKQRGARATAEANTSILYEQAAQETPVFDSPEIQQLLSTDYVKEAVNGARKTVEAPLPNKGVAATKADDSLTGESLFNDNSMFGKAQRGEPIKFTEEGRLADNSYEILAQARRNLKSMQESPDFSLTEKRDIGLLEERLTTEMMNISDQNGGAFGKANAEYALQLSKVDALRKPTIEAIKDLAGGNVQLALGKLMRLPPKDLEDFVKVIDDKDAFKDAALGYVRQKLDQARGTKEVASKLISAGEWKNLNTLLGDDQAQALKATIDAESKLAKSTAKVSGGSDTTSKLNAQGTLAEMSGEGNNLQIGNVPQNAVGIVTKIANFALSAFNKGPGEGNPQNVKELADALVLSLPKGIEAMEKVLKARGLKDAEVASLKDYLLQAESALKGTSIGMITSATGQIQAKKGKKKK